jgi:ADP-ribose pyrophosphatase YjhB (NUDIX family)
MWAFPGGFMHMDETAEEGAKRELKEATMLGVLNGLRWTRFLS